MVRGAVHQDVRHGERRTVGDDSMLVATWRKEGQGLLVYYREDRPDLHTRRYKMDVRDTVRALTEYIDRLDGTGMEELHAIWFRMTEMH